MVLANQGGWRELTVIMSMPPFFAFAVLLTVPESPRWLYSQGRVAEASAVIKRIARMNHVSLPKIELRPPEARRDEAGDARQLFGPEAREQTYKVLGLWLMLGFSFYAMQLMIVRISNTTDDDCSFDYSFMFWVYFRLVISISCTKLGRPGNGIGYLG